MSTRILGKPDAQKTPLSDSLWHPNRTVVSAYALCRRAERDILMDLESPFHTDITRAPLDTRLVCVRLLGHLMDKGPGDTATSHIAKSVVSAADNEELFQVGKLYLEHFVCAFRRANGPTPESSREKSPINSPLSFDTTMQHNTQLTSYPINRHEAEQSALARDNFRCVVSGALHLDTVHGDEELMREVLDQSLKLDYAEHAQAILKPFWYSQIFKDLAGGKIHSLKNVLTMSACLYDMFDTLELWFEATDESNCYKVCTTKSIIFVTNHIPRFVKFKSTSPKLELPSVDYLGLHAACSRVAHMSGAMEYLDMLDDLDDTVRECPNGKAVPCPAKGYNGPKYLHSNSMFL
ncbi:hypothetical protein BD779DRAFT_1476854 [Infundibulicybe gibba]|nr:hypothetical protein BD779DRAFT_1476854 [Infundibulicybe gibba]